MIRTTPLFWDSPKLTEILHKGDLESLKTSKEFLRQNLEYEFYFTTLSAISTSNSESKNQSRKYFFILINFRDVQSFKNTLLHVKNDHLNHFVRYVEFQAKTYCQKAHTLLI